MSATLADVHNIIRDCDLSRVPIDPCDFRCLAIEYEQQKSLPFNDRNLLYVKQFHEPSGHLTTNTGSHFIAVIQTSFQRQMLQKFGPKVISIDGTHGVCHYEGFKMVTILGVDEAGRGIPFAHCILNHEDEASMEQFFSILGDQLRPLAARWFVSDDYPAYFNAWKTVIGGSTRKVLCIWHVRVNVDKYIDRHIKNLTHSKSAKFLFRSIMYAYNAESCQIALTELKQLLQIYQKVLKHLEHRYCERLEQWSLHLRVGCIMSTSGHLESYHR